VWDISRCHLGEKIREGKEEKREKIQKREIKGNIQGKLELWAKITAKRMWTGQIYAHPGG
jgi:hypothetical protein